MTTARSADAAYAKNSGILHMQCEKRLCPNARTYEFVYIESRQVVSEVYLCSEHAREFFDQFKADVHVGKGRNCALAGFVVCEFELIAYHKGPEENPVCVYLHEVGGVRRFCTLLNAWSWWAIMAQIRRESAPRPLTHAAWSETIGVLGGRMQYALLDGIREADGWFDARVQLLANHAISTVDVRFGDALALAVAQNAPIYVSESALAKLADRY
jgi:bifunctional DNase/RNase